MSCMPIDDFLVLRSEGSANPEVPITHETGVPMSKVQNCQTIPVHGFRFIQVTPENESAIAELVGGFGLVVPDQPDTEPKVERVPNDPNDPFTGIVVPTVSRDGHGAPYRCTAIDATYNPRVSAGLERTSMDIPLGGYLVVAPSDKAQWPFDYIACENESHFHALFTPSADLSHLGAGNQAQADSLLIGG